MNTSINTFLILNILSLIILTLNMKSPSTIKLLISLVIITFFQGLSLICLGVSILGIYLIIIYIGAIVILFAFCILFINSEVKEERIKDKRISLLYLVSVIISLVSLFNSKNFSNSWLLKSNFKILSENSYLKLVAIELYNKLILPLIIMIMILILGLVIVIRVILNKE
jgi:NADH-quinone oxidoreductase subunit J